MTTGVKPISLPVLSTEPVLRKVAVDREMRPSTEQYGLSTEGVRFVGALLESNLKVFFNIFLSDLL